MKITQNWSYELYDCYDFSPLKKQRVKSAFCDLNRTTFNQISGYVVQCRSLENLPFSQKFPFHPELQPKSQTPFTALQLIQLDPHLSMQFLPNDPLIHPKEIQSSIV